MTELAAEAMASPASSRRRTLPFKLVLGWGVGSFAFSTMYQVTTVLLLRYFVDYVGLAAAAAGALIAFTKIFDVIIDPIIGMISDRTNSRWGRRRPYILLGGVVSGLSFMGLFSLAQLHPSGPRNLAVAAALVINTCGYALMSIPHLAMPAEMTSDFNERTYLMSFRVGGLSLAQLSGSVLGPYLIARYGGGAAGHAVMGVVLGLIIMVGAVICFASTGGAPATAAQSQSGFTTWQRVRLAFGNKPFVSLLCAKMANLTAVGWYFAVLPFLFTTVTRAGYAKLGLYFFAQGLATLFSQPFWVWTSRRIGKKRAFYITATCYGLGVATWFLAQPGDPVSYSLARGIVLGFLGGGSLLTASSMLPDAIEHDFNRTGLRREGIFAGVYTTVEKASAALSSSLIGVCLSIGGYVQGAHGAAVQPPSAILAIRLSTFAPLIFGVAGALILTTYRLPDKRVRDPS